VTLPDGAAALGRLILPRAAVAPLDKLCDVAGGDATVAIGASDARLRFTFAGSGGETVLDSKLIAGTFPDTDRVVPKDFKTAITCERDALITALARCRAVGDAQRAARLEAADGTLALSLRTPDGYESADALDATCDGPGADFGLSTKYLLEALDQCTEGPVTMRVTDASAPVMLLGAGHDPAQGTLQIIMPMRV
jgi:DNA polymerase-3 subunit beta